MHCPGSRRDPQVGSLEIGYPSRVDGTFDVNVLSFRHAIHNINFVGASTTLHWLPMQTALANLSQITRSQIRYPPHLTFCFEPRKPKAGKIKSNNYQQPNKIRSPQAWAIRRGPLLSRRKRKIHTFSECEVRPHIRSKTDHCEMDDKKEKWYAPIDC